MKKFDGRLRTLEDQYFFSVTDAHVVVRLLSEAAQQHVPEAHHSRLVRAYAHVLEEMFRFREWVSEEGLSVFIQSCITTTLTHCTLAERRRIQQSLDTWQEGEVSL